MSIEISKEKEMLKQIIICSEKYKSEVVEKVSMKIFKKYSIDEDVIGKIKLEIVCKEYLQSDDEKKLLYGVDYVRNYCIDNEKEAQFFDLKGMIIYQNIMNNHENFTKVIFSILRFLKQITQKSIFIC
jgi:hypothetical protein